MNESVHAYLNTCTYYAIPQSINPVAIDLGLLYVNDSIVVYGLHPRTSLCRFVDPG